MCVCVCRCTAIHNTHLQVLARIKKDTMQLYLIDISLYYNYIYLYCYNTINTHLSVWLPIVPCIYRVPPLLVSKLILSDVILS